jgi:hypothetical protein
MLKAANFAAPSFDVTKNTLDFVRENSINGQFAIRTAFNDDPTEKQHFVKTTHLALCGDSTSSGSELLESLIIQSGLSESNLVAWDSKGEWEEHEEIKAHAELRDFNEHLQAILDRGYMNGPTVLVAVNGIDPLLSSSGFGLGSEERKSVHLLSKVLLEGRRRNIALYTFGADPLYGSDGELARNLRTAVEVVLMGAMPLRLTLAQERIEALPQLVKGWLVTAGSTSWWQVRVPEQS